MYLGDKGVASHARSKDRCLGQGERASHKDHSNGGHSHTTPSARQHSGPRPHTWYHSDVRARAQSESSGSCPGSLPQAQSGCLTGTGVCALSLSALSIGGFCPGPLL